MADSPVSPGNPCLREDQTISSPSFTCLAVETATELPSIALLRGSRVALREARGMQSPSRAVFDWVRELLDETGTRLDELDCIAFGAGPGSFTGVRIAVALAQSLGYARGIPLCPVSTLAALAAAAARSTSAGAFACCLDARMGEVYVAAYVRDQDAVVRPVLADRLCAPAAVQLPGGRQYLAVGPGWTAYPEIPERLGRVLDGSLPELLPSAQDVLALAQPLFTAGKLVTAVDAIPNYLRDRVTSGSPGRTA